MGECKQKEKRKKRGFYDSDSRSSNYDSIPMLVKNGGISYLLKVHKNILLSYNVLSINLHGCSLIIGIYDVL